MKKKTGDLSKRFERLVVLLSHGSAWFAWMCLWAMVIIILIDISGRRLLGRSTHMADEFSGYFLVVITFMGAAYTLIKGRHVSVEVISEHLSGKTKQALSICTALLALAFIAIMTWYSLKLPLSSLKFGSGSGTMLNIPLFIPQLIVPVGLFLLGLAVLSHILRLFRSGNEAEDVHPSSNPNSTS